MSKRTIQAAGSATAAGAASADAIKTAATTADDREFTRAYRRLSRRNRRVVEYLILGTVARNERRPLAALAYWAAACATNPTASLSMLPHMRRLWQVVAVALCAFVLLTFATACSGDNAGSDSSAAALRAKYGATQPAQNDAQPAKDQPAPTLAPTAQISATETPDMQPQSIAAPAATVEVLPTIAQPTTQPAQVVDATQTPQPVQIVAGIDESMQPCPARFWKRGRCTATQAQIDAAASEVQP